MRNSDFMMTCQQTMDFERYSESIYLTRHHGFKKYRRPFAPANRSIRNRPILNFIPWFLSEIPHNLPLILNPSLEATATYGETARVATAQTCASSAFTNSAFAKNAFAHN